MTEIVLECKCGDKEEVFWNGICMSKMLCSTSTFIVLKDNQYFCLLVSGCHLKYQSSCEFIESVLQSASKKYQKVARSWSVDNEFKELRLRGTKLKQITYEVNYIYENNARKEFAIVTKKPYIDYVLSQNKREYSYKKAFEYLKLHDVDMLDYLNELHQANSYYVSDYEVSKNIEHVIKQISKRI